MTEHECCCTTPEYTIRLSQQGPQGLTGEPGADGFSPEIEIYQDDVSTYKLSITTKEGGYITPNLKGNSIPLGGTTGQLLIKQSGANLDVTWGDLPIASTSSLGAVQIATAEDFEDPDEDDYSVVNPYMLQQISISSEDIRNAVFTTQDDYDNLDTPDANTLYLIAEEE